eukprot:Hpha_TRINITY_DN15612_c5_g1::TRINITY_DN15612_c5_g1_i1::g.101828::m.101828
MKMAVGTMGGDRARPCLPKLSNWIMRESDTLQDVRIKRGLTPLFLFVGLLSFYFTLTRTEPLLPFLSSVIFLAAILFFMVMGKLGMDMGLVLDIVLVCSAVGNILNDVQLAAEVRPRSWTQIVVVLDVALLYERTRTIPILISMTVIWLFLTGAESTHGYGLYNAVPDKESPIVCNCLNPPCGTHILEAYGTAVVNCVVLLVDYFLTRNFAYNLRIQLQRVKSSVEVAVEIASALAKYDVDVAEEAIAQGENLPEELAESFRSLLGNLRSYRDFLPDALLSGSVVAPDSPRGGWFGVAPPVGIDGRGDVGMVFTDIQSS